MTTKPRVLMIVTQDTKLEEGQFLRACLEEAGCEVVHLDASVRRTVGGAEIGPEAVAAAAGQTIEEIRAIGHEGKIQLEMIKGALALAQETDAKTPLSGVISIGGSMGTTLGTAIMRSFPYGLPKVMISTLASGFTAPFVSVKDIVMMNSVCDIAGINSITRGVYRNGAFAVAGMAHHYDPKPADERPLVLISTLGTLERGMSRLRTSLEAEGYEVMVFHTTGMGGQALDAIAAERPVAAVVDMSLVEINDLLHNGICTAGPDRSKAALARGVPVVFAPGNADFYIMPSPMAVGDDPFGGRRFHIHNAALTAVRTSEDDLKILADHVAGLAAEATGPVRFYVPLRGFSNHDSPEGYLHEPSLPPKFADYVQRVMPASVDVRTYDAHLNDDAFADALRDAVREMVKAKADA